MKVHPRSVDHTSAVTPNKALPARTVTVTGRGAMPRYTVHVRGEWLAVPCQDAQLTVGWLGREAVRRYLKNKPDNGGFASVDDARFLVRRCTGLGLLDNEDPLDVALEDNEFVEVGEWLEGRGRKACSRASSGEMVPVLPVYRRCVLSHSVMSDSLQPHGL